MAFAVHSISLSHLGLTQAGKYEIHFDTKERPLSRPHKTQIHSFAGAWGCNGADCVFSAVTTPAQVGGILNTFSAPVRSKRHVSR
jgi:hypothetical protein